MTTITVNGCTYQVQGPSAEITDMREAQKEWCARACKEHKAFNTCQIIQLLDSMGDFRSEASVFEIVRLMKNCPDTYGSCFHTDVVSGDKVADAMKSYKRPTMEDLQ